MSEILQASIPAGENSTATQPTTTSGPTDGVVPKRFHINILKVIKESRDSHGARTKDYNLYRSYCTNHLYELRSKMDLKCKDPNNKHEPKKKKKKGEKKKESQEEKKEGDEENEEEEVEGQWNPKKKKKKPIKKSNFEYVKIKDWKTLKQENNGKELFIPLFLSERCWIYSQQLYDQFDQDHLRKYHHSNNKLRKAIVWAEHLYNLSRGSCDNETQLQSYAYLKLMQGNYDLQTKRYSTALESMLQGVIVLEQLHLSNVCGQEGLYLIQSVKEKLSFLESTINNPNLIEDIKKQVRLKLERTLSNAWKELKEMHSNASNIVQDVTATATDTDTMEASDSKSIAIEPVTFDGSVIQVTKYPALVRLIPKYRNQLEQWNKLCGEQIGRSGYPKRYRLYFKMVRELEQPLKWVTKELEKYASGISDAAKPLYVVQQYLNFQLARVTVARLQDWQSDQINRLKFSTTDHSKEEEKKTEEKKKTGSKSTKAKLTPAQKNGLFHDLALLCEEQIKQIDILHESGNAAKHLELEKELDCLRQSFEIQRRYYIGRIYYANGDFYKSDVVFEALQPDCQQYLKGDQAQQSNSHKFTPKWDEAITLAPFVKVSQHLIWIQSLFNECRKFAILSKAKVVLDIPDTEEAKTSLEKWEIEDFGLTLCPLLPKPVIFDLAWNHIEYDVEEKDVGTPTDNKKHRHHRHDNEEAPPTEMKEEQEQQSRKKWFGIF